MAKDKVKQFILNRFMPGQPPDVLDDDVSLVNSGIIDSTGMNH